MASKKATPAKERHVEESLPFGAGALDDAPSTAKGGKKKTTRRKTAKKVEAESAAEPAPERRRATTKKAKAPEAPLEPKGTADGAPPRAARSPRTNAPDAERAQPAEREDRGERAPRDDRSGSDARPAHEPRSRAGRGRDSRVESSSEGASHAGAGDSRPGAPRGEERQGEGGARGDRKRRWQERRRKKRKRRGGSGAPAQEGGAREPHQREPHQRDANQRSPGPREAVARGNREGGRPEGRAASEATESRVTDGILVLEQASHGHLRHKDKGYMPSRDDVHVSPRLVQKFALRDGARIVGSVRRGQGRHKWDLDDVKTVDGKPPGEVKNLPVFKSLRSIDPDFHYAVGDGSGEVSLKVVDCLCPVGRGQRGLIVAPPRSGKTILMQQFAHAIEKIYPEVHLMVLLLDERPEEATEWKRSIEKGEVYVSTNDETAKKHVELAEVVWRRCKRLVEMGEDVILLLDSITRMGRAYNNVKGNSGKTMSGGIDTQALERPKQFFGAARNTETAGSLTILATALVQTGSRMDQVIFEEFKGTGNMELVLSRKLADRRIFPAIDIEKTGTRKDEKLHSKQRLHRVNVLRRVLMRMHWAEAIELLVSKLDEVERIDDFLKRFDADPDVD